MIARSTLHLGIILSLWVSTCLFSPLYSQDKKPQLLIRVDDIGMNHAVNTAVKQLLENEIPFSASVMFACPWYQEAVAILKDQPQVAIGVHLTLNAEWKYYRWGPVLGKDAVPGLVDSLGYFLPSVDGFLASDYRLDEVEKELTAQIERALASGLPISYVDPHMGMAVATPELRAVTEKLAKKYGLGISTYFGERYKSMWGVPVETKKEEFMRYLGDLNPEQLNLVEIHVAHDTPEMNVLMDLNSSLMNTESNLPQAAKHRQTELEMLLSPEFETLIGNAFELITYSDLISKKGLESMERP